METVLSDDPHSSAAEAFRGVLAALLAARETAPRTLVVTSSLRGEGKTTAVCNLGLALASIGCKTLLIDGDIRKPRLHELFSSPGASGLGEVSSRSPESEDPSLHHSLNATAIPHLHVLQSGVAADQGFRLLTPENMRELFQFARQHFDYVLVDAPACASSASARTLASCADAVLFIVRANRTPASAARMALKLLRRDGSRVIGMVLNGW